MFTVVGFVDFEDISKVWYLIISSLMDLMSHWKTDHFRRVLQIFLPISNGTFGNTFLDTFLGNFLALFWVSYFF